MDELDPSKLTSKGAMEVNGIRISPAVICFLDVKEGGLYTCKIRVQNIGVTRKHVAVDLPRQTQFLLKKVVPPRQLPSGLDLYAVLQYSCKKEIHEEGALPISINWASHNIPIKVIPARVFITVEPKEIPFGTNLCDSRVITKSFKIKNHGHRDVSYKTSLDQPSMFLSIEPPSNTLPPYSEKEIFVRLVAKEGGPLKTNVVVESSCQAPEMVELSGLLVVPALVLMDHRSGGNVTMVDFGPALIETERYQNIILFNDSPEPTAFLAVWESSESAERVILKKVVSTKRKEITEGNSFSISPSQGRLKPYEVLMMNVSFHPQKAYPAQGWQHQEQAHPHPKSLLAYLSIQRVHSGARDTEAQPPRVTLHGVVHYVDIDVSPDFLDFGSCANGKWVEMACNLTNNTYLQMFFRANREAHFAMNPCCTAIPSRTTVSVKVYFRPRQYGAFKRQLLLTFMGRSQKSSITSTLKVLRRTWLTVQGVCVSTSMVPQPRFSMGLKPIITNETGFLTGTVRFCDRIEKPWAAVVLSQQKQAVLMKKMISMGEGDAYAKDEKALVAFPNDRARSIRPWTNGKCQSIFKRTERYTYDDFDYSLGAEGDLQRADHHKYWLNFMRNLFPPKPRCDMDSMDLYGPGCRHDMMRLNYKGYRDQELKLKQLEEGQNVTAGYIEQLRAVGKTYFGGISYAQMKKLNINFIPLEPTHLCNVMVHPDVLLFNEVMIGTETRRYLSIANMNPFPVHIKFDLKYKELAYTPKGCVILPPTSNTRFWFHFRAYHVRRFETCMQYIINFKHSSSIPVLADGVPPRVELSHRELIFTSVVTHEDMTGYKQKVTLHNPLNGEANFTWTQDKPDPETSGQVFVVEPSSGHIKSRETITVEVTYISTYSSPTRGTLLLHMPNAVPISVQCKVHLAPPHVYFLRTHIEFGALSLCIPASKVAVLRNDSHFDAPFYVAGDLVPPGLSVDPLKGVVKGLGTLQLNLTMCPPVSVPSLSLDVRVQFVFRESVVLVMRLTGQVYLPRVVLEPSSIDFGGVRSGSYLTKYCRLANFGQTESEVTINLDQNHGFAVSHLADPDAPPPSHSSLQLDHSDRMPLPTSLETRHVFRIPPSRAVELYVHFMPEEVSLYDFESSLIVNGMQLEGGSRCPTLPVVTSKHSKVRGVEPQSMLPFPVLQVKALSMRPPIEVFSRMGWKVCSVGETSSGDFTVRSLCDEPVHFSVDLRSLRGTPFKAFAAGSDFSMSDHSLECSIQPLKDAVVTVSFCPEVSGKFYVNIPFHLNREKDPFNFILARGECLPITMVPTSPSISFVPVPLDVEVRTRLMLIVHGVKKEQLNLNWELDFRKVAGILDVMSPSGRRVQLEPKKVVRIPIIITFKSQRPVSLATELHFSLGSASCTVTFAGSADNSILTTYIFLAFYAKDYEIRSSPGEYGQQTMSTTPPQTPTGGFTPRLVCDSVIFLPSPTAQDSDAWSMQVGSDNLTSKDNLGSLDDSVRCVSNYPCFPEDDSTPIGQILKKVVSITEKWMSEEAFPGGMFSVTIPDTLCEGLPYIMPSQASSKCERVALHKRFKTILDALTFLSGEPNFAALNERTISVEPRVRATELFCLLNGVIVFLHAQGGHISHVRPENLMDYENYKNLWDAPGDSDSSPRDAAGKQLTQSALANVQKQCWLDVVLQMYKCLVAAQITPKAFKQHKWPPVPGKKRQRPSSSSLEIGNMLNQSNVYSSSERYILIWLNHHFASQRDILWPHTGSAAAPYHRSIVNFDTDFSDGLVLAAVVGAYCPYAPGIRDVFRDPVTYEQRFHNAAVVIDALVCIRAISKNSIKPQDIVHPHMIGMFMLCVKLFDVLPQYYPKETIYFQATLGRSMENSIKLTNNARREVRYNAMFIMKDDPPVFLLRGVPEVIPIPPKTDIYIMVLCHLRRFREEKGTLVLLGVNTAPMEGPTMAFNLIGQVKGIELTGMLEMNATLYKPETGYLRIASPFEEEADYDVFITDKDPEKGEWTSTKILNPRMSSSVFPSHFILQSTKMRIPLKPKKGLLKVTIAPLQTLANSCWFLFSNERLGDFVYRCNSLVDPPNLMDTLIAARIKTQEAAKGGPLRYVIYVPNLNEDLWKTVRYIFQESLGENDKKEWGCHLMADGGPTIIRSLFYPLAPSEEPVDKVKFLSKTKMTYHAKFTDDKLIAPHLFTIELKGGTVPYTVMKFDVSPGVRGTVRKELLLLSDDKCEIRRYTVEVTVP